MNACADCGPPWSDVANKENQLLVIPCSGFGPSLDEDTRHHRGVYPKYLQKFVSERFHEPLIEAVLPALKETLAKAKKHINIVFLDYNGVHSSVAACKVTAAWLKETPQFRVATIILHAPENDTARRGSFADTFYPEEVCPAVQDALDTVVDYYHQVLE